MRTRGRFEVPIHNANATVVALELGIPIMKLLADLVGCIPTSS